jgi:hypothetical protein
MANNQTMINNSQLYDQDGMPFHASGTQIYYRSGAMVLDCPHCGLREMPSRWSRTSAKSKSSEAILIHDISKSA